MQSSDGPYVCELADAKSSLQENKLVAALSVALSGQMAGTSQLASFQVKKLADVKSSLQENELVAALSVVLSGLMACTSQLASFQMKMQSTRHWQLWHVCMAF